jgi:ABC-type amino acid transport substrate-binding protein
MRRAGDQRKAEQGVDMKRLSIGILTLMLAIPALPVGDRTSHAADSILTNVLHRGTVRMAITTGAPPNGILQGYDIDIANLLAKQLGVTIDYIKTDTAGRVAMLQTKKSDITIASFTPNIYVSDQPG